MSSRSIHADVDVARRRAKARKVIAILEGEAPPGQLDLLEIGTGSGVMAEYFAQISPRRFRVSSVDVVDVRVATTGYEFVQVEGSELPFPENSFDVVVSNQVLEHVGNRLDQVRHLSEMRRMLKPNGVAYLATPNRWAVVEPHFRLPMLSWLPRPMADSYVRLTRRGQRYDCLLIGPLQLRKMINRVGLKGRHVELEALTMESTLEGKRTRLSRLAGAMSGLARRLWPLSPTFVVMLRNGRHG